MQFEIKDLTGLGEPLTKLMEVTSKGFGVLWRPRAIRLEADAKAYEIEAISKAEARAEITRKSIEYESTLTRIQELSTTNPELASRAKHRLLLREIEGQENLESVVEHAYTALPNAVSGAPVDETWRRKFFQEAENICDEEMQLLWGKVLAGEVSAPGSYSHRTLSVLCELSAHEAEIFKNVCSLAMTEGHIALPGHDPGRALSPFGISYENVMSMRDAGLISSGDSVFQTWKRSENNHPDVSSFIFLMNNDVTIQFNIPPHLEVHYPIFRFTVAGRELQRLMISSPDEAYLSALGNFWRTEGINAKRGTEIKQGEGVVTQDFEKDL